MPAHRRQDPDDTVGMTLYTDTVVVNDTVRVTASLAVSVARTEDKPYEPQVRAKMDQLVPGAKWQFSGINRTTDPTNAFETVSLQATARIPETQNRGLTARARELSEPGFTILNISTDTQMPRAKINEAERGLRKTLMDGIIDFRRR